MKILILTQNISDKDGMNKGLTQAQTLLAPIIPVTFDFKETTKQFTSIPLNSDVVHNGYEVNPNDILSEEQNGYDITLLIYDWNFIYPHPTNPCINYSKSLTDVPIQIPVNFYSNLTVTPIITYPEVLCEFFLHEYSHFCADEAGVRDLTHFKYDPIWNGQFSQSSNIDYYLYLIKQNSSQVPVSSSTIPVKAHNDPSYKYDTSTGQPNPLYTGYIAPVNSTNVFLKRELSTPKETLGTLTANINSTTFKCRTLELPWLNNLHNISCIPTGTYFVKWTHTFRFPFGVYQIQNVPNRTGIDIHSANYFSDLLGCVGLGSGTVDINNDGQLDVINSRVTLASFIALMGKKDFTLVIQ